MLERAAWKGMRTVGQIKKEHNVLVSFLFKKSSKIIIPGNLQEDLSYIKVFLKYFFPSFFKNLFFKMDGKINDNEELPLFWITMKERLPMLST